MLIPMRPVDLVADGLEVGAQLLELGRRVDFDGRMGLAARHRFLDAEVNLSATLVAEPGTAARGECSRLGDL